jgi:adenylate kinase
VRIMLLGSPGAGKGTQATWLCEQWNIPQLATGNLLRAAVKEKSSLGQKIAHFLAQGQLVPDALMIDLVSRSLGDEAYHDGFLLDGFPRTLAQAQALSEAKIEVDVVLAIEVADDVVVERLSGRRIHPASGRTYHVLYHPPVQEGIDDASGEALVVREDDQKDVIRHRLALYHEQTEPLCAFYEKKAKDSQALVFSRINGEQSEAKVRSEIERVLVSLK